MAASITLTGLVVAADGITVNGTLSGGTGTGYSGTTGGGILIYVNIKALVWTVTSVSIVGSAIALTLAFPIPGGAGWTSLALYTNNGGSSNITDSGGNSLQTQSGPSVTNNSTANVAGFNSNAAGFHYFGGFTTTVSNNRNLFTPQPSSSGFGVGFTGTAVALVCQTNNIFATVDNGAHTQINSTYTSGMVILPIATGLSDTAHDLRVTNGTFWDAGTGTNSQGTILVYGAAPAIHEPTGSWGSRYFFDQAPFDTEGEFNPLPLLTSTWASRVYRFSQAGQGIRFRTDSSFIGLFSFRALSTRNLAVYQDGVAIALYTVPNTPSSTYQRHVLVEGLSGEHEYEIVVVQPLINATSASWYDAHLELDNSGVISSTISNRPVDAFYGDSITGMGSASPPITDLRVSDMWIAARPANRWVAISGTGGGKVHTTGRDGTSAIPAGAARAHVRYGTNDLGDIGSAPGSTNFQTSYGTMIDNIRARIGAGKPIYCYQPFPRSGANNRAIAETLILAAISGKADVIYINTDNWSPTTSTYMHDGLHPTAAGYALMGNRQIPIYADTAFEIDTPETGAAGAASNAITVTLWGGATFTGDQTVTLTSDNASDVLTPSVGSPDTGSVTVTPANGATSFTFTITRSSAGTSTITPTAGQSGWTMPAAVEYTAEASSDVVILTPMAQGGGCIFLEFPVTGGNVVVLS